jgi:hypothetical protein
MSDRTVKVRLEADISDFVSDIGVKAPAAIARLEASAKRASATLKKTSADGAGIGDGVESGTSKATAEVKKFAADTEKTVKATGEKVKKTFEKSGSDSGRSFGAGLKKWLTGSGADLGRAGGSVFGSGFLGALKTPILGPAIVAILTGLVLTTLPAVGAVAGGAFVTGFGAGIAGLGIAFAAQNDRVKKVWSDTLGSLGRDMQLLAAPFQSVLVKIAGYFKRTVDDFNPELSKAFSNLAQPVNQFANDFAAGLEKLIPAIAPLSSAFSAVLADLGPALTSMLSSLSDGLIELSHSVEQNPKALGDMVRGLGDIAKSALDLITILNDVNGKFSDLTGGVSLVKVTMAGLQSLLTPLIATFTVISKTLDLINALSHSTDASGSSMSSAAANTVLLAQGYKGVGDSAQHAKTPIETAAEALARAKQRAQEARDQFERFISTTFRLQNQLLSLSGAQISFQAAIDAASAAVKENGRTLDINTEKGRANRTALNDVAKAANDQTESIIRTTGSHVQAAKSATASRASFVKLGVQMGLTIPQARAMAASLIAIPNVTRTAKLQANITDLESKLATAKAKLKDPHLTATQKAKLAADISKLEAGIAAAKSALASVPASKTVTITANTYRNLVETTTHVDKGVRLNADGGYYPASKIPSYANGKLPGQATIAPGKGRGMVQWAEQETGGEAFIPLAPSKRDRSEKILGQVADKFGMGLVRSFADGGFTLPGGRLVDIALILKQLGLPFDPVAGVNYNSTLTAANRANRAVVPARDSAIKADRAEQAAKAEVARIQRLIALQQRAIAAARAGKPTTKAGQAAEDRRVAAEQKKLIGLQDQLYVAKKRTTAATVASNKADAVYKIRAEQAAKAAEVNKAALEKLVEQQKAAVDLANQIATGLTGDANIGDLFGKSLTGKGLLADLQSKGADLAKFRVLIDQLRKSKLSEDLIQQIIGKGSAQGGDLAQAILNGGLGLVASLNKAQKNLDDQANLIGAGEANAQYGVKVAGARAGGGGVTAGMTYRVNEKGEEFFTAPINGHVIPADVDPNRYIRTAFGGGSSQATQVVREVHHHQTNQFHGVSMAEADLIAQRANAKADLMNRGY